MIDRRQHVSEACRRHPCQRVRFVVRRKVVKLFRCRPIHMDFWALVVCAASCSMPSAIVRRENMRIRYPGQGRFSPGIRRIFAEDPRPASPGRGCCFPSIERRPFCPPLALRGRSSPSLRTAYRLSGWRAPGELMRGAGGAPGSVVRGVSMTTPSEPDRSADCATLPSSFHQVQRPVGLPWAYSP
jgi:hypothetical protein